ncbi:MAG: cytochrome C peroxidase [Zetaproteobacteria bacterium CG12_big_fil_rev_8_21_14_0_65_55_1124]|nr:MAG: cytochrome C peroxidase [Zetaproteobacteria bacterium CG1_02_55_237]PIS20331.1 MAG: cytochrome C peroxidase [Zetaproteobacteria bacterium CG08_land_8_20_14_0_20_55_17]PIW42442.1 MAG: cytochrome C peroxidase [Zetaproteobacteria bacterium CG12_big_fil_rev_8_21_14_0_65_55_1124]PIY52333.1 MAG: cytochrome C peroxidase [Zetaproteobacteria bacterium CG_4_10_14_0_8_um_filter_55_43]PIZ37112.1 MAG: cytochrome C peroxidase [Zetaproteobacteria bacterium CG_4_10_14_0_2_um_filter_55_20]PJB81800.1 MA
MHRILSSFAITLFLFGIGTAQAGSRPADVPDGMGPLPAVAPIPADNPMSAGKIELGKKLYFDPALSKSGNISCNSCHNLANGGVDNQRFSIGHLWQHGGRNAPTVLNSAFWTTQFWDGRAPQLEDQAKGPPMNPVEMADDNPKQLMARLKDAGYAPLFSKVFGKNSLNYDNMAKAIAAFERTLLTPDAPFDRYVRGEADISKAAKRGMRKVDEIGCTGCHSGPLFTNNSFQRFDYGTDAGRKAVTGKAEDDHFFRVQSWRNVALTAPYFHDGSVATLDEAVRIMAKKQLDTDLSNKDVSDIVAFLNTLTGTQPEVIYPLLPRPAGRALDFRD